MSYQGLTPAGKAAFLMSRVHKLKQYAWNEILNLIDHNYKEYDPAHWTGEGEDDYKKYHSTTKKELYYEEYNKMGAAAKRDPEKFDKIYNIMKIKQKTVNQWNPSLNTRRYDVLYDMPSKAKLYDIFIQLIDGIRAYDNLLGTKAQNSFNWTNNQYLV